jgi:CheY-like chemotaxis protein
MYRVDPPMKILLAEDDIVSRTLMIEILASAQAGYEVVTAEDGAQAWTMLEANPEVKLAIIDVVMPVVDGFQWLDRVRADPRFGQLPVIVCSGNNDRATVSQAAARGVSSFLVKPFTRSAVLEKVLQITRTPSNDVPVMRDLGLARQRLEIDRDVHRDLIEHHLKVGDLWAADARRATEYPRVRALGVRAENLKQVSTMLGCAALAARFQEAGDALAVFKTRPLAPDMHACLHKTHSLATVVQAECDRLRVAIEKLA